MLRLTVHKRCHDQKCANRISCLVKDEIKVLRLVIESKVQPSVQQTLATVCCNIKSIIYLNLLEQLTPSTLHAVEYTLYDKPIAKTRVKSRKAVRKGHYSSKPHSANFTGTIYNQYAVENFAPSILES